MTISLCIIAFFSDLNTAYKLGSLGNKLEPRSNLTKRNSGEFTFYGVGLGACGKTNSDSELVCAISTDLFGSSPGGNSNKNPNCGRTITATFGGKSVDLTVVDVCEGCKTDDVDMSPTGFDRLAAASAGRIKGTWEFTS
ncbi:12315_t:CDS:1 [Dentiscutata erythropus]|uniref:12315_t:CDS:1 n=1 Tax=Dentiscutata erythropus TaxID=1348616 RepID=A0A9N9DW37_9GLOM|nr:12315_t:CDS:1 [Dentiscutata erythropus]